MDRESNIWINQPTYTRIIDRIFFSLSEILRIQGKLQKYGTLLRYFSFVILTFLYLQVQAFSVDISTEFLLPKSE